MDETQAELQEELFDKFGEEYYGKNYGEKLIFLYLRSAGSATEAELSEYLELAQRSAFIAWAVQGALAGDIELVVKNKEVVPKRADKKTRQKLMRELKGLDIRLTLAARNGKGAA